MAQAKVILLATVLAAFATPAFAADPLRCLSAKERRAAVANKQAQPLGRALRNVRGSLGGDIVRARLCEGNGGLVYMLTVLARDGKVTRAAVDALNGRLLPPR